MTIGEAAPVFAAGRVIGAIKFHPDLRSVSFVGVLGYAGDG